MNDIATIRTLPLTTAPTKFVLTTFFVYPHAMLKCGGSHVSDEGKSSIQRIVGGGGGEGCLHPVVS